MSYLDKLYPYVRTGTTEGDLRYLSEVFVTPSQLAEICGIEPGSLRVLLANKGAGKTAIVEWLKKTAQDVGMPCVLMRPDELVDTGSPSTTDISSLKGFFYEKLLRSIAVAIGSQIGGYIPLVGDKARLYDEARNAGLNREDAVTRCLRLISAVALPAAGINGVDILSKLSGKTPDDKLGNAINNHLLNKSEKTFLLLIDDTDQLATPDDRYQLNKIWALILAVRRIAMTCESVRPIVTLRSSVWARLAHEDSAQRDQIDHIRPLIVNLRATNQAIVDIAEKRMIIAYSNERARPLTPYGPYFEGDNVSLPRSEERRLWKDFISKSARERPRDALQLIKSMIDAANAANHTKIGDNDAAKGMDIYSDERVADVVAEYSLDLPNIKELIGHFRSTRFEMTFSQLREHLRSAFGVAPMVLRGKTLHQSNDGHFILILGLLYEVGFMNARVPDNTKPKGFDHKNFADDPIFVRQSNWNELQASSWEVHPAFRSHLLNLREANLRKK